MTEKKLIGIVLGWGIALALVVIVVVFVAKNVRAAARQEEVAALAASLDTAVSQSNEFIRNRDFEQARTMMRTLEPSIITVDDFELTDRFNAAFGRVITAEREHKAKLKSGWTVFEGEFISPDQKQRLLVERQRQRDEELRRAEHERQLAEARKQKAEARRQKKAAERKRREAQRLEEERRKAEAERKAMQPTSIRWVAYKDACGVKAQQRNEARSESRFMQTYRGKRIHWSGQVTRVDTAWLGSGFVIWIRMRPPDESLESDIMLSVPRELGSLVLSLDRGDFIQFVGIITVQSGTFNRHHIDVEQLSK